MKDKLYTLKDLANKRVGDRIMMQRWQPTASNAPDYSIWKISRIFNKNNLFKCVVFIKSEDTGCELTLDGKSRYGITYSKDENGNIITDNKGKPIKDETKFYDDPRRLIEYTFHRVPSKRWHNITEENIRFIARGKYPLGLKKGKKIEEIDKNKAGFLMETHWCPENKIYDCLKKTGKIPLIVTQLVDPKDIVAKY